MHTFHYTDKSGWNAIRAQRAWQFKAYQPNAEGRPFGAYFTDLPPTPELLRTFHQRLRIPNEKKEYVFWFNGRDGLQQVRDGRGRDKHIYYSPGDYPVEEARQKEEGETEIVAGHYKDAEDPHAPGH